MSQFFVIDGTDGSGKATQTKLIEQRLTEAGYHVLMVDFPQYGQRSAALAEDYLNGEYGSASEVTAYQASVFFAADRFTAKKQMQEHLAKGGVLLSNRYVTSNQIHQSGKISNPEELEQFLKWLDHFEYELMGIPRPDQVLFLDVPPHVSKTLVESKEGREYIKDGSNKDIHEADTQHIQDAYDRAVQLVKRYSSWQRIDCLDNTRAIRTINDISDELYEKITAQLAN